jgi:hypothetical protein
MAIGCGTFYLPFWFLDVFIGVGLGDAE